jgi:hypothetical protein
MSRALKFMTEHSLLVTRLPTLREFSRRTTIGVQGVSVVEIENTSTTLTP